MSPLLVARDGTQRVAHVHPSFPGHCWASGTASCVLPRDLPSPLITRGSPFPTGFTLSCEIPAVVAPSASWLPPPSVAMDTRDPPLEQRSGGGASREPHPLGGAFRGHLVHWGKGAGGPEVEGPPSLRPSSCGS